jgi:hypothetical protein
VPLASSKINPTTVAWASAIVILAKPGRRGRSAYASTRAKFSAVIRYAIAIDESVPCHAVAKLKLPCSSVFSSSAV